jgi:hypothetical protein
MNIGQMTAIAPGRSCPLHYRYAPRDFARDPDVDCETLYVVGGLYGNEAALATVLRLFGSETGRKRLVFNGDFNWFNVESARFEAINKQVLEFDALRGNVETELTQSSGNGDDAGCGCAYPDWVSEGTVERSNRIMRKLRATAGLWPALTRQLAALPMTRRVDVGDLRVAIVHGDAESLAGWGFAQEHLRDGMHRQRVRNWFDAAKVDIFASSHTCLPVFHSLPMAARAVIPAVLNNGAAGMPNFKCDPAGLLTRISVLPFKGPERRFGICRGDVHLDAIAIDIEPEGWQRSFLQQWPEGSDAHASYWQRILYGPDYKPAQALITSEN